MSTAAVGSVNYLLSNAAGVTTHVAAARIFTGVLAQDTVLPAILVRQVSGTEDRDVAMGAGRLHRARIQVTVYTDGDDGYTLKKTILKAVRDALAATKGTVNGVAIESILPDGEGPDLDDPGKPIFEQSRDFLVVWHPA